MMLILENYLNHTATKKKYISVQKKKNHKLQVLLMNDLSHYVLEKKEGRNGKKLEVMMMMEKKKS